MVRGNFVLTDAVPDETRFYHGAPANEYQAVGVGLDEEITLEHSSTYDYTAAAISAGTAELNVGALLAPLLDAVSFAPGMATRLREALTLQFRRGFSNAMRESVSKTETIVRKIVIPPGMDERVYAVPSFRAVDASLILHSVEFLTLDYASGVKEYVPPRNRPSRRFRRVVASHLFPAQQNGLLVGLQLGRVRIYRFENMLYQTEDTRDAVDVVDEVVFTPDVREASLTGMRRPHTTDLYDIAKVRGHFPRRLADLQLIRNGD